MKKMLCIAPHLSTGGLPQFLLKKIKSLKEEYEIHCVEYNDVTGGVLVVQRNQIIDICKDRFYTLGDDKFQLFELIDKIKPDIIHFEEMPEYFMDMNLTNKIYNPKREYLIVETSHDSSFDSSRKRVFPDQFIFVSRYQKQNVESLNINAEVIEYPISVKRRKNREEGLNFLGLDVNKKHVFHVGLFTPRKNQKEFIEYARMMENENVQFHCVGNMADNFRSYWEPLLKSLPKNVKVWGERKDVDNFYSCMDLFLFTSRGHSTDKETAPIVIKEAITYNVPSLLYNLPVYLNRYNDFSNISYLDETDFIKNIDLIKEKLSLKNSSVDVDISEPDDTVIIISTHPNHKAVEDTTKNSIIQAKKAGFKVILTSHYPASIDLQNLADYYVYDKNNPILKHNFYSQWNCDDFNFKAHVNFKACDSDDYHGLAVCLNYYNGINYANGLGFKKAICYNFDLIIDDLDFEKLNYVKKSLNNKKGFFFYDKALEGDTLKTVFHGIDIKFYLNRFDYYTKESYTDLINKNNITNGLEQFYYTILRNDKEIIHIDYHNNEESFFKNSNVNLFSMVEYLTVLPVSNRNEFCVFSLFSNKIDERKNVINIYKNGSLIKSNKFNVNKGWNYLTSDFESGNTYNVENIVIDESNNVLKKYNKTFESTDDISINGYIQFKK